MMSNNNYTDITFILDRSGSMIPIKQDVIGGFNSFITEQKALPGKLKVTLVQFDNVYEAVFVAKSVDQVPVLDSNSYQPRGSTALLDAIGRTINDTGARLRRMSEKDRPAKVLVIIYTDGQENASNEFTKDKIKE